MTKNDDVREIILRLKKALIRYFRIILLRPNLGGTLNNPLIELNILISPLNVIILLQSAAKCVQNFRFNDLSPLLFSTKFIILNYNFFYNPALI